MKLLLNDKEIAYFLLSLIDYKKFVSDVTYQEENSNEVIAWYLGKKQEYGKKFKEENFKEKLKVKLDTAVKKDLENYYVSVKTKLSESKENYYNLVHKNIEYFIKTIGEDFILDMYKIDKKQNFVKSVGFKLDSNATMIRRHKFQSYTENCLIRNTVGNENLLISKIDNRYPFYFIDSGYTNFLESNKVWHRIVRNHLHYGTYFDAPSDRLKNLKSYPSTWREDGEFILIIEPGPFAAGIFHVDLKTWKYDVEKELRRFTDKKIRFREKAPKKERVSLYKELLNDDYYCTVSINSNAATESIWAGVPSITLDKHVSNPVTKNKLSEVNDLYRGPLGNWLCYLSYNQFTFDELINGRAIEIMKKYHV
jgi:hypothetical protein